jgi:hypothetical protein
MPCVSFVSRDIQQSRGLKRVHHEKKGVEQEEMGFAYHRDQQGHSYRALGAWGQVIANQADQADERAVQASREREEEKVGHAREARVGDRKFADEANTGDREASHDERGALLDAI